MRVRGAVWFCFLSIVIVLAGCPRTLGYSYTGCGICLTSESAGAIVDIKTTGSMGGLPGPRKAIQFTTRVGEPGYGSIISAVSGGREIGLHDRVKVSKEGYETIVHEISGEQMRKATHWVVQPFVPSELPQSPVEAGRQALGDPPSPQDTRADELSTGLPDTAGLSPLDSLATLEPQPERVVYYLPPSLRRGGLKKGVLSFTDDICQMSLRSKAYPTADAAKSAATKDTFWGSLLVGSPIAGGLACLFVDDHKVPVFAGTFVGYFVLSFLSSRAQLVNRIESQHQVFFDGEWVQPEARGLEKRLGRWVDPDIEDWNVARASGTAEAYQAYLRVRPGGRFATRAQACIDSLDTLAWDMAVRANTADAYRSYCAEFPGGKHQSEAQAALDELAWQEARTEGSLEALRRYRLHHKAHDAEALAIMEGLLWQEIQASGSLSACAEYMSLYPNGQHRLEATSKLDSGLHSITWQVEVSVFDLCVYDAQATELIADEVKWILYRCARSALDHAGYQVVDDQALGLVSVWYEEKLGRMTRSSVTRTRGPGGRSIPKLVVETRITPVASLSISFVTAREGVILSRSFEDLEVIKFGGIMVPEDILRAIEMALEISD